MGAVKSVLLAVATGTTALVFAQAPYAQSAVEVFVAGELIKAWIQPIGFAVLASDICHVEGADVGRKAVLALDRRYRRCLSENTSWAELPGYLQLSSSAASPSSVAIGSQALAVFLGGAAANKVRADGGASFCKGPWRQFLLPGATADQTASQQAPTQGLLKYMEAVHAIADYERWGEAPCDSFFPPSLGSK